MINLNTATPFKFPIFHKLKTAVDELGPTFRVQFFIVAKAANEEFIDFNKLVPIDAVMPFYLIEIVITPFDFKQRQTLDKDKQAKDKCNGR